MATKTALAKNNPEASLDRIVFNDEQIELIRSQIAPNAKPDELALFLYQARRTGLDPLARQIYCIHRSGRMTIQTSIDGFRVVAERSSDYGGQDAPEFIETDGKLIACRVAVYRFRGDIRYQAAVGVAYMSEYNAGGTMWAKMPHTMLAKCAEAQALRKAYPQDLSGLYTGDEMEQADSNTSAQVVNEPVKSQAAPQQSAPLPASNFDAPVASDGSAPSGDPLAASQPAVQYATASQKDEIIRLLSNPMISRSEKTKMMLSIHRITAEYADKAITKLKGSIEARENGAPIPADE